MEHIGTIEAQLARAKELSLQDKPEEALEVITALDDGDDLGGLICFARGNIYLQLGQFALADENYNLAINKGFVDFKLYMNLAGANVQMGRPHRAELLYRQAAELDPTEIFPLGMVCQLRLEAGDLDGAVAVSEEMIARHPTLIDGFRLKLETMLATGLFEDAMALLTEIEARFSAHPAYILFRAFVLSKLESPDTALGYLEERESCFFDEEARVLYAREQVRLLTLLGKFEEAKPLLQDLYQDGGRDAGLALIVEATMRKDMQEVLRLTEELSTEDAPRNPVLVYILLYRAAAFWQIDERAQYRETLKRIMDVLREAGDELGLEMRLMRVGVLEQLEQYTEAVAELDDITTRIEEHEDTASDEIAATLARIAEKRAEVAAKMKSFT